MIGVSTEFKGACFIQFKVYIFLVLTALTYLLLAGIPFLAEGKKSKGRKVEVDASVTQDWKYGIEESFSKTYTGNLSVSAAARRNIRATATVSKAILVVPYTITSSPKRDPSIEVETKGTWRGLVSWKLTYTAEDGKLLFIRVEYHCSSFNHSCLTPSFFRAVKQYLW